MISSSATRALPRNSRCAARTAWSAVSTSSALATGSDLRVVVACRRSGDAPPPPQVFDLKFPYLVVALDNILTILLPLDCGVSTSLRPGSDVYAVKGAPNTVPKTPTPVTRTLITAPPLAPSHKPDHQHAPLVCRSTGSPVACSRQRTWRPGSGWSACPAVPYRPLASPIRRSHRAIASTGAGACAVSAAAPQK